MTAKTSSTALAAGLLVVVLLAACTDGSSSGGPTTSMDKVEMSPATSVDLLDRVDCDRTERYEGVWYFGGPTYPDWIQDCYIDEEFVARLATFQSAEDRAQAVEGYEEATSLNSNCSDPDGTPASWVVAGEDWMAISTAEDAARVVADRTGASMADYSPTEGPPPSFFIPTPWCP